MDKPIETLDLAKIRKALQIENEELLNKYLKDIWSDLSKRSEESSKGITKITFIKYYELPGIISDRLFDVFDKDKDGILSLPEFQEGMRFLFSQEESFNSLAKFIFNFYDFRKCDKIKKDDVKLVLSYVSLQKKDLNAISEETGISDTNFQDRVESQEQLFNILKIAFKDQEEMNFDEYINVIKNVNSDIFLLILMFLLEKKPFSSATIKNYIPRSGSPSKNYSKSPEHSKQVIASPTHNSRFLSPKLRKKNLMDPKKRRNNPGGAANILQLYSGVSNKPVDMNNFFGKDSGKAENEKDKEKEKEDKKDDKASKRPQRRVRIKLDNLMDKTPEISKKTFTFGKNVKMESDDVKEDDFEFDIGEEKCEQFEGYVYKYSTAQNKMKKTYFKLIGKDLYYYKNKEEEKHRGMHNLSGVYIKKGENITIDGKTYFNITIVYKEEKAYYFDNEEDFKIWFDKLNMASQNKSVLDKYDIKDKIGKGAFGLVKSGINKETNEEVAVKIMAKKNMDKSDIELAKVEIDILKIGQHPNIIKLHDVYENENYIYIVMEKCTGGDLLSYFEKRNYELPESRVCEIIHKLSMAIYYLHSYGIVHRDLKPENILMTDPSDNADIRLLDFGLSKIVGNDQKCTEPYGTLAFVAPEVLLGKPYDKSVDLWSIGIITFLLLCGYLPFDDKHSEREIARQTIQEPVPFDQKIWGKLSPEAKTFVDGLLKKKPEERLSIKEVLEHPWFKKMTKVNEKRNDTSNSNQSQFGIYTTA